jgi:DNA-directed RNA polymerase specialized sigma24 family protein
MSEDELERLRESLSKLRKWERELLSKRFCEGYTIAMLAKESLFWSESTIRNRLAKALEHLRTIYQRAERPKDKS